MKRIAWLPILALLLIASWAVAQKSDDGLPILRKSSVHTPNKNPPVATEYAGGEPGENRSYGRTYQTAPPMIPHTVKDYLPITTRNECLNCHLNPSRDMLQKRITPISPNHFKDRKGQKQPGAGLKSVADIYAGYYNCSMCHAPQANAKPLVENLQRGD